MTSYGVAEKMTEYDMCFCCVLSSGGGVIDLSRNLSDVRIGFGLEVVLPSNRELSQIMPESGEVAPIVCGFGFAGIWSEHFGCEFRRPEGDFVEVAVIGIKTPAFSTFLALALIQTITEWGEKRFPP